MEAFMSLLHGFSIALTPYNLMYGMFGCILGTAVGVLPGLGPTAGMAILIPVTMGLPPITALIMLAGIYYGSMYGGSTTAIMINMPGEAAAVPTSLDGYIMAKQGKAGQALAIVAIASFLAGTIGNFLLMLIAPPLADFALAFGPPEYFSLMLLGLTVIVSLSGESMLKGITAGILGLLLSCIGLDPLFGLPRLTFGFTKMMLGVDVICAVVGLFAVAEVLNNIKDKADKEEVFATKITKLYPSRKQLKEAALPMTRGSFLGFFVGILPGASTVISAFLAYDLEKKLSRHPETFGKGAIEGIASAEAANNSAVSGGMVPLLTLGLPVSAPMGILFAALMIHGLRPGPLLFVENVDFVWGLVASMYIGNAILLVLNLPLVRLWVKLTAVPYPILVPIIVMLSIIGTFSIRNSMFDVAVAVALGLLGFIMQKFKYPVAPLIIGLILGNPFESAFRQSLTISNGSMLIFVTRPISVVLLVLVVISLSICIFWRIKARKDEGGLLAQLEE